MIILKTKEQIDGIREVCHLTADMFNELIPKIKAGLSTKDVDDMFKEYMLSHGGKAAWWREDFPGAICISINDEIIHGLPSKKRIICDGDLVSIDVGIDKNGYISDTTHSLLIGNVPPKVRKLQQITEECLYAGIAACVAGNRISDISNAVYSLATKHGYGVVSEYCGHGVGIEVHEDPSIPNCPFHGANPRIRPGMVLAIEPMINLGTAAIADKDDGWTVVTADGEVSCHEEHTVAVFEDHTEILTDLHYAK
ncbi:type I methionyl aminopeptidase [Treponema sp. Marseille-Q3903]|uniref:type I methionyl aminopeptidase n=1 Tax=Treponema sp. Marseille-Q3903 TaxID=2766703 RepID=UPI001652AD1A|nr:type I methionyl aminopeptidase [Treponema sp. Marseille-Q3903]MBC6714181.1 type I methionyl aminopeptidase [Treponema sp. Marseille-Q3903]